MPVRFYPDKHILQLETLILKEDGSPLHGEIEIYKKLFLELNESSREWHIWHDLKLPSHSELFNDYKKTSAQIDFLILCDLGILVLEVKGGAISVSANSFYYGKHFNDKMKQDPFRQAEGYKHTLKDNILNNLTRCLFCHAVAFPHVNYHFESKIFDVNLLWTKDRAISYNDSIERFIISVFRYFNEQHKKHFRIYPTLGSKEVDIIKRILSPTLADRNKYKDLNTLEWLQVDNLEILEGLYKNKRIMIEGPPGSGKTTIAKAFIDQQQGKNGLYLCWNNLLMHHVRYLLNERDLGGEVEVTTLFRLLQKLNPGLSYDKLIRVDEEGFYELMKESIGICEKNGILSQYDYIVIDEGQDMFDRGIDIFLDRFCGSSGNGLQNGNILILYDIDQSYTISGRNVCELADLLTEYFAYYKLNEVKRSAQNQQIRALSSDILDDPSLILRPDFQMKYSNIKVNHHDSLEKVKRHLVHNVLNVLRSDVSSLRGEDCIILVESTLLKGEYNGSPDMHYELTIKDVEELTAENIADTANKLRYTSILKYKGLEKKNVFLVITEPGDYNKYEIFVGITRAIYNVEINIVR